jgi:hypothetical protein
MIVRRTGMKKGIPVCLLLLLGWGLLPWTGAWADVGWMQTGVRVWYLGGVGGLTSSNAEEAYLFEAVDANSVRVTRHSAVNHWGSPHPVETGTYALDKGPIWIHPQALAVLQMGDSWKGQEITLVVRSVYTYDMLPYRFLPAKALFDLKPRREVVKIVYMIPYHSTGTAYFDAETGLLLLYSTSDGFTTVFFVLSEINYSFADKSAFAEDDGPHTGFKSLASEQSLGNPWGVGGGSLIIQSLIETRYGDTVEMRVLSSNTQTGYKQADENYCFFGSVPVLRYMDATEAPNFLPEQWNAYGQYLWWWVPRKALQRSAINVLGVPMTRLSTDPYTFAATGEREGLFFPKLFFGSDGYMTAFAARDPTTGLAVDPGDYVFQNLTTVAGLEYYRNTMGIATPRRKVNITPILGPLLLD